MNRYTIHSFSRKKRFIEFNIGDRVKYNQAACDRITRSVNVNIVTPIDTWRGSITHKIEIHNICVVRWDHIIRTLPYDSEIDEKDLMHE